MSGGAKDLDYRYRKNRERLKREAPAICGICGGDIDLELPPRDPGSWSADHIVPLNNGGDPYDYFNLQPAHFGCNSRKQDRTFVKPKASRRWLAESLLVVAAWLGLLVFRCAAWLLLLSLLDFCCCSSCLLFEVLARCFACCFVVHLRCFDFCCLSTLLLSSCFDV